MAEHKDASTMTGYELIITKYPPISMYIQAKLTIMTGYPILVKMQGKYSEHVDVISQEFLSTALMACKTKVSYPRPTFFLRAFQKKGRHR